MAKEEKVNLVCPQCESEDTPLPVRVSWKNIAYT